VVQVRKQEGFFLKGEEILKIKEGEEKKRQS
jgi:hypothetical protein